MVRVRVTCPCLAGAPGEGESGLSSLDSVLSLLGETGAGCRG